MTGKCLICCSVSLSLDCSTGYEVVVCESCNFQHIRNNLNIDASYFDGYAERNRLDENRESNKLREKQYLIDAGLVEKYSPARGVTLDVGCSYGGFIDSIKKKLENCEYFGIDIDDSAINEATQRFSGSSNFIKTDLASMSDDVKFDTILFRGTFQYLGCQLHESMRKLERISKKNTNVIIFSLPSTDSFVYYLLKNKWALFHAEMPLMFNEKSIRKLAENYGYSIKELSYPYLSEVYADKEKDYENIIRAIKEPGFNQSVPFWGSIMQIVMSKQ